MNVIIFTAEGPSDSNEANYNNELVLLDKQKQHSMIVIANAKSDYYFKNYDVSDSRATCSGQEL